MARAIVMPSTGMYTAEGKLVSWLRPDGTMVNQGEAVAEIETEKAMVEIEAPAAGVLRHIMALGTMLEVEGLIGYILDPGETLPVQAPAGRPSESPRDGNNLPPRQMGELRASPLAKRLAAEHSLDLHSIAGTGPGGRIVEADVMVAVAQKPATVPAETRAIRERIPLSGMRRTIGDRMRHSLANAASLTLTREVRADALVSAREAARRAGRDLPYDAFFIKLLALALREHSGLNSMVENDEIVVFQDINIGFAVSVKDGLVAPVVKNADAQPVPAIAAAVRDLTSRAREGRLRPSDLTDCTASMTNLGAYGVDAFTPILNPPQSVILGIGRIAERPVIDSGRITAAATLVLSLTFDHRVADGAPAAELLDAVARQMVDREFLESLVQS